MDDINNNNKTNTNLKRSKLMKKSGAHSKYNSINI